MSVVCATGVFYVRAGQAHAQDVGFGGAAATNPNLTIPSTPSTSTNINNAETPEKTSISESTRIVVAPVPAGLAEKPLYQLRIRVTELQKIYDQLGIDGALESIVEEAYIAYKKEKDTLDIVEKAAAVYLKQCLQRHGINTVTPIVQMTPAGPRWMSPSEIVQSQSQADPEACDRLNWVDQKLVDDAHRLVEVEERLEKNNFYYGQGEERAQLEEERALLRQRFGLPRW